MAIETADNWWNVLAINRQDIESLVARFHPGQPDYRTGDPDLPVTASAAEAARRLVAEEIAREHGSGNPVELFNRAVEERDHQTLVTILNRTWFGIPESDACWSLPGFGGLCDLCSEAWVFTQ